MWQDAGTKLFLYMLKTVWMCVCVRGRVGGSLTGGRVTSVSCSTPKCSKLCLMLQKISTTHHLTLLECCRKMLPETLELCVLWSQHWLVSFSVMALMYFSRGKWKHFRKWHVACARHMAEGGCGIQTKALKYATVRLFSLTWGQESNKDQLIANTNTVWGGVWLAL